MRRVGVAALLMGSAICVIVFLLGRLRFDVRDPGYRFEYCDLIDGSNTNHVLGNPLLAKLNGWLGEHGHFEHQIGHHTLYRASKASRGSFVYVGYTQTLDATNRYKTALRAEVSMPNGDVVPVPTFQQQYSWRPKWDEQSAILPKKPFEYRGAVLRLYAVEKDDHLVATVKLK